ncbi:MAG: SRPBCC family protein [Candidatus Eisenbacteria bacterium]
MGANDYHFVTRWIIAGTREEIYDLIGDAAALPRWWPSVYLDARVVEPGEASGVGKRVQLFTKGWLPYTLRWEFVVTEALRPERTAIEASGDFVGRGVWNFTQVGPQVAITYDWRIRADKPLLRTLSFVMKPLFAANHRWAMERGRESLALELMRRRARNDEERRSVPAPPGPTFRPRG